ncbi:hypothetical protein F5887DRAFT_1077849 [Amanita rubescens]|nr:hypothetical protein F5887DRAFT_1077849 [Amanita rubescens]
MIVSTWNKEDLLRPFPTDLGSLPRNDGVCGLRILYGARMNSKTGHAGHRGHDLNNGGQRVPWIEDVTNAADGALRKLMRSNGRLHLDASDLTSAPIGTVAAAMQPLVSQPTPTGHTLRTSISLSQSTNITTGTLARWKCITKAIKKAKIDCGSRLSKQLSNVTFISLSLFLSNLATKSQHHRAFITPSARSVGLAMSRPLTQVKSRGTPTNPFIQDGDVE